jgi:hypothetical protein
MKTKFTFSVVARIVAAGLLFWALSRHQIGYYNLLRWITCGVSAYCVFLSYSLKRIPWACLFGFLSLLFNPIVPIRLDRQTWAYLDVASGIFLLVSIYFIRESLSSKGESNV